MRGAVQSHKNYNCKIDFHGYTTSPPGCRQSEMYCNTWDTSNGDFGKNVEVRGGTSKDFLNYVTNSTVTMSSHNGYNRPSGANFKFGDYGTGALYPEYGGGGRLRSITRFRAR